MATVTVNETVESVVVEIEDGPTIQVSDNNSVVIEALAGIQGATGSSGFVVQNGAGYPSRPPGASAVVFVGTANPDTLGIMQVGDSWINTAASASATPYVRGDTSAPVLATNILPDPNFVSGIGGWRTTPSGAISRTASGLSFVAGNTSIPAGNYLAFYSGQGGPGSNTAAVEGESWNGGATITNNSGAAMDFVISTAFFNTTGTTVLAVRTTPYVTIQPGASARINQVQVAPANTATVGLYIYSGSIPTPAGGQFTISKTFLGKSTTFQDYFSGDDAGSHWTGTPYASNSEKLLTGVSDNFDVKVGKRSDNQLLVPDSTQTSGWRFTTTQYIEGTGFPTMDAPVGTMYVDLAATNGAIRWIKTAIGAGIVKWSVEYGDTGWRNVTSLLTNGWTGTGFFLRRIGQEVTIRLNGVSPSNATSDAMFAGIPSGFGAPSPTGPAIARNVVHTLANIPVLRRTYWDGGNFSVVRTNTDTPYYGDVSAPTDQSWPTTLPGTAG